MSRTDRRSRPAQGRVGVGQWRVSPLFRAKPAWFQLSAAAKKSDLKDLIFAIKSAPSFPSCSHVQSSQTRPCSCTCSRGRRCDGGARSACANSQSCSRRVAICTSATSATARPDPRRVHGALVGRAWVWPSQRSISWPFAPRSHSLTRTYKGNLTCVAAVTRVSKIFGRTFDTQQHCILSTRIALNKARAYGTPETRHGSDIEARAVESAIKEVSWRGCSR